MPLRSRRILLLILANLLVFLIIGGLLFGAAEIYFRIRYPKPDTVATLVSDPVLGWDTPDAVMPLSGNSGKGSTVYFLGDSFVHGKEWPSLTQEILRRGGTRIDGFSLGASGHGTTQQLVKLENHLPNADFWIAVLLFFAWNDMRDNQEYPAIFYSPFHIDRPYLRSSGSGYVLRPPQPSPIARILSYSDAHARLTQRFFLKMAGRLAQTHIDTLTRWGFPLKVYYDEPNSWMPFYDPARAKESVYVRNSYAVTEESLKRIRDLSAAHGAKLIVIGIDNAFTVDRDVFVSAFGSGAAIDTALPLREMTEMAERLDIPFIDGVPRLQELSKETGRKVYNDPPGNLSAHLEPEGEQVLAEIAAREIRKILAR